jgi:phospholipid/cholesterol/gamma-HCH transport system permease protein
MGLGNAIASVGAGALATVARTGDMTRLLLRAVRAIALLRWKPARVIDGVYVFGWRSIAFVSFAGLFVGMGIALQVEVELRRYGVSQNIANINALAIVRELGPILAALLLAGRAGSGITAELGAMQISDQLSAMKMLGLDVMRHFVAPMILSVAISNVLMTVIFDVAGILGGYLVAVTELKIPISTYHAMTLDKLTAGDAIMSVVKAGVFGTVIGWFGCYNGLTVTGGGRGLGEATKRAVVSASFAILITDFFLNRALIYLLDVETAS